MTRARIAQWIVFASITIALAVAVGLARDTPDPSTPENAVAAFVDAFNERDAVRLCDLLSGTTRQAFEAVALDSPPDTDELLRAFDRWDTDNPDHVACFIGADAASDRVGHISSGAITRTVRETRRLAYVETTGGRWKLTWDGNTWNVARHPRLQTLADAGEARP